MQAKPFEQMVNDARKVHGDKYIYDENSYVNARTPMKIFCKIHGEFQQTPHSHINKGRGCSKCNGGVKRTQDEYISIIKSVHGDRYDLSEINYKNSTSDVTPICNKHGKFVINARKFLLGHGCQKCYDERRGNSLRYSLNEVIEMCKAAHGDKYIYNKCEYHDMLIPFKIVCPIHGEFLQTPAKHIHQKQGCPKCNASHLETEISDFLDKEKIEYEQYYHPVWLGLQSLDFYLPKYNVGIECQGIQHYEPISFSGDKSDESKCKNYEVIKERDQRKKQLCEENGVKLLYFTHYDNVDEDNVTFKDRNKLLNEIEKYELRK